MLVKRIGNNLYCIGRFDTRENHIIVTRDHFNLMFCIYGFGFAVLKHIEAI